MLHSFFYLQLHTFLFVVNTVVFISICFLIMINFITLLICLLISEIVTNCSNSIFKICKFVCAFSINVTVSVNGANYNVNFVKLIKM